MSGYKKNRTLDDNFFLVGKWSGDVSRQLLHVTPKTKLWRRAFQFYNTDQFLQQTEITLFGKHINKMVEIGERSQNSVFLLFNLKIVLCSPCDDAAHGSIHGSVRVCFGDRGFWCTDPGDGIPLPAEASLLSRPSACSNENYMAAMDRTLETLKHLVSEKTRGVTAPTDATTTGVKRTPFKPTPAAAPISLPRRARGDEDDDEDAEGRCTLPFVVRESIPTPLESTKLCRVSASPSRKKRCIV